MFVDDPHYYVRLGRVQAGWPAYRRFADAMQNIGIIYLFRHAEGESPALRFLQSYRDHPPGLEHDFHVIFKGFPDRLSLERGRALFADIPINAIELEDTGFDIGSFAAAVRLVANPRLILLNTFSEIQGDGWLKIFDRALSMPGVGLVGATGSWLSNASGYEGALRRVVYRIRHLPTVLRAAFGKGSDQQKAMTQAPMKSMNLRKRRLRRYLMSPFEYVNCLYQFGRYPNPHIRTNAFMIERSRFLSLSFPSFNKKSDCYRFESGRRSLTRQILGQGLQPVVVGRNSKVYPIAQWDSSNTFWRNNQSNLLVADNRTRDYAEGDADLRWYLEDAAWVNPWSWRVTVLFRKFT